MLNDDHKSAIIAGSYSIVALVLLILCAKFGIC